MRSFFLLYWLCSWVTAAPFSVVVVGGGPAGLAAAIEAHQAGAYAVIVEKRSQYTRSQIILLYKDALDLLEKWEVEVPEMTLYQLSHPLGIVEICHLENALAKRALNLGIAKLFGTFKDFSAQGCVVDMDGASDLHLPFDLLVGADGMHSTVRNQLGISTTNLGYASGTIALLHVSAIPYYKMQTQKRGDLYVRKVWLPPHTALILAQSPTCRNLTQENLGAIAQSSSWDAEAAVLKDQRATFISGIPIALQKANAFSDSERKTILIGDAAAAASFFQWMGLPTALKTAELAGKCVRDLVAGDEAYHQFNANMEILTESLIDDSRYLFDTEAP